MSENTAMDYVEATTAEVCPRCAGDILLVANGGRPLVDLTCSCGVVCVLCG